MIKVVSNRKEVVPKNFAVKWETMFCGTGNAAVCKSAVMALGAWGVKEGVLIF